MRTWRTAVAAGVTAAFLISNALPAHAVPNFVVDGYTASGGLTEIGFGVIPPGTSKDLVVTIRNNAGADPKGAHHAWLDVVGVFSEGATSPLDFDLIGQTCGTSTAKKTFADQASCTMTFRFTPSGDGLRTGLVDAYLRYEYDGQVASVPASTRFVLRLTGGSGTCGHRPATIIGTSGSDTIHGTGGNDVIMGLGGKDKLVGRGGRDVICGGDGGDKLIGSGGNDRLFGDAGKDWLAGGADKDRCHGGVDDDVDLASPTCEVKAKIP